MIATDYHPLATESKRYMLGSQLSGDRDPTKAVE